MSNTRRFSRIAAAVAAGLFALVCAVPTTAIASSATTQQQNISHTNAHEGGGGWCC